MLHRRMLHIGAGEGLEAVHPPLREPQALPQEALQPGQGPPHLRPRVLVQQTAQPGSQVSHHRLEGEYYTTYVYTFIHVNIK